jgi:hypothetical protein
VDAVAIMEAARIIDVRALADFFMAMAAMKAHWYNLMVPSFSDPSRAEINAVFPPLSALLNLDIITMEKVLEVCGLSRRKGNTSLPTMQAWENFIAEYKLDIEVTTFNINNKRRYFVRIGSFDASRHPAKMPICYWRDHNNKEHSPPKLRLNKLTAIFAENVGCMGISFDECDAISDTESIASSTSQQVELEH